MASIAAAISLVKQACRQDLDLFEWTKDDYRNFNFEIPEALDRVPRIDCRSTPHSEFVSRFEEDPGLPVVLLGATDGWNAQHWTMETLQERFSNEKLKVGETNGGRTVYMSMDEYTAYLERDAPTDDSPLYIFDSLFADRRHRNTADKMRREAIMDELYEEDPPAKKSKRRRIELPSESVDPNLIKESREPLCAMLLDYQPPYYFSLDLFSFAGESSRPPYRWVVIGPKRAGTYLHIDPLGTSAWNALMSGKKRWALFPPGTPKHLIDPPKGLPDREAVTWFSRVYPTLNKKDTGMIEIIQRPGETVFVPGGWAHVVMNLDLSLAITQNFCSPSGLERCYLKARTSRPKFTQKWVRKLPEKWKSKLDVLAQVPLLPLGSSSSSPSSTSSDSDSDNDA